MTAIDIRDLTFTYRGKRRAGIRDISVKIKKNDFVLLAGPSGSGKSTLLRCINGLVPHKYSGDYKGDVFVLGRKVRETPVAELAMMVGTVLQEIDKQFVVASVEDDVAFGPSNLCLPRHEIKKRVENSLAVLGILDLRNRGVYDLSGGQKQRVAIAGVLALEPDIILLDEPLANLDSKGVNSVLESLKKLWEEGKTIIIAEHRTEEVINAGVNRILVIKDGKLVEDSEDPRVLSKYSDDLRVSIKIIAHNKKLGEIPKINLTSANIQKKVAIRFENVYYRYPVGVEALKGIDLEIKEGERIALLGNNGAGKSTLALHMIGILKPTKGRVLIYGKNSKDLAVSEIARSVGIVFQDPFNMLFAETVRKEMEFGPKNLGFGQEEIDRRVEETAKWLQIEYLLDYSPYATSHGEKKRVCVAAILTMLPKILILDEPTAGQDYKRYKAFLDFITHLITKTKHVRSLILITHETDIALEYTDRTIIMNNGKIVADGPTRKILADVKTLEENSIRVTDLIKYSLELTDGEYVLSRSEIERMFLN
ncbi:MAG: ABC transporter ATP-binding protein [Candidatus Njordarchaeum guaymaensis]